MYTLALDVSTHSVVANSKRLIVGVALVVNHAAAQGNKVIRHMWLWHIQHWQH